MRRILASTFVLALLTVALAAPPIDYELTCGEGGPLVGVLSLTEGEVHVALVEGVVCQEDVDVFAVVPEGAPTVEVTVDWTAEPIEPVVEVEGEERSIDLVVVPQVAVDGMLTAQRLRAAAMEMRREAAERGETDRDRDRASWDDDGAPGDGEPGDPPDDAPHGDGTGEGPSGPPEDVPPGEGQGPGSRP